MTLLLDLTVWMVSLVTPIPLLDYANHYQCVHDRKFMSGPNTKALVELLLRISDRLQDFLLQVEVSGIMCMKLTNKMP
jgi:hypothetical protein